MTKSIADNTETSVNIIQTYHLSRKHSNLKAIDAMMSSQIPESEKEIVIQELVNDTEMKSPRLDLPKT